MRVRKGTISRQKAEVWLMEQGYDVFEQVCGSGPVDLVAIRNGEIFMIDVKTVTYNRQHPGKEYPVYNPLTDQQRALGVRLLYVQGGAVFWGSDIGR